MLIPEQALRLIDEVSDNRTAFMLDAAVCEAKKRRRQLIDAEIARICAENHDRDLALAVEFEHTLLDGLPAAE